MGASYFVQASLRDAGLFQYPYRGINPPGYRHSVAPRRSASEIWWFIKFNPSALAFPPPLAQFDFEY
jgi:hypothetical protein